MKKLMIKFLLSFVLCIFSVMAFAQQSAGDNLFATGVKLQQTMTIASQNKAISYFEKAKICYDSQAKKELCDQQIKACRNIIAQIAKNSEPQSGPTKEEKTEELVARPAPTPEVKAAKRDVELSLDCTYLKFKGRGKEFKKVKVHCNYSDWKITEIPSWANCSRNENNNEIVVEVGKNPNKEERSGILKIECGDKSATLTIIQEKIKKLGIL